MKKVYITVLTTLYSILLIFTLHYIHTIPDSIAFQSYQRNFIASIMTLILIASFLILAQFARGSLNVFAVRRNLTGVHFANHHGQTPFLLSIKQDGPMQILHFYNVCIPLEQWQKRQNELESALNLHIADIYQGKNLRHIYIKAISGNHNIANMIPWSGQYLSSQDFVITLGIAIHGPVTVDFRKTPHMLIGGSTGSGKTILLQNILFQCQQKGAEIYIADFKGGIDYPGWSRFSTFIVDKHKMVAFLTDILKQLETRKALLQQTGFQNIYDLNQHQHRLNRMVIAVDEIAELLDKSGLSKGEKDLVIQLESQLSTIARLGRAFGIHLILATQRPDANVLSGQIRNNLDTRICGRADNILSQMILDTTDASSKIPKNAQGRFLTNDGTLFQGFWFHLP